MNVKILVTGGVYEGRSYVGPLSGASPALLPPDGIESARTIRENAAMRTAIAEQLRTHTRVTVGAVNWAITVTKQ